MGLIWAVQVVQYPLFARIGREAFPDYHAAYLRRVTPVVGPLMVAEAATALGLLAAPPPGTCPPMPWVGAFLIVVIWISTAFLQVPCHRQLEAGFDANALRLLVRTNWVRTLAWTARGILVGAWLFNAG